MPLDGVVPHPPEFAARYRAAGHWEDRTLDDVFGEAFRVHAGRAALHWAGETISYGQLGDRREALAARLHRMGLRPLDRVVVHLPKPLAHNMPLACPGVQGFLLHGGRVALSQGNRAGDVFPLIERHGVTHVAAVPALYIRWLADPAGRDHDLASVRLLQSGGQRLQPEVRRQLAETFPNAFVQENFGMSEGTLFFVRRTDPEEARTETVGTPASPGDEVRLADEDGREVPDGEVGELTVRGPYTLRGYYRAPEHNARAFSPDGFYRSGDLMRRHPSGAYLVEGRIKDLVNRGSEKISAEEVENLILGHPAVRNVACIPVPDPVLGERMCACVIPREGRTLALDELVEHLLGLGIAKFKLPERLELMADFPLSPFGKVSKKALAERVA